MKIKKFASTVFALALGLGLAMGLNYAFATTTGYTPPAAAFPSCDPTVPACNTPINVGPLRQTKPGDLVVNGFTATNILASAPSEFASSLTVDGLSASSPDRSVCADTTGKLVLCNVPGSVTVYGGYNASILASNIAGYTKTSPTSTSYTGSHTAFTGAVQFQPTWVQNSLPPNGVDVILTNNSTIIGCKLVTNSMYYTYNGGSLQTIAFNSATFNLADSIAISVNSYGSCTPQ